MIWVEKLVVYHEYGWAKSQAVLVKAANIEISNGTAGTSEIGSEVAANGVIGNCGAASDMVGVFAANG